MKTDLLFPPPQQFNQPPLPCSDIPLARLRALARLAGFAARAESLIGEIPPVPEGAEPLYKATSRGFALHCLAASPFVSEAAELLALGRLTLAAADHVDAPHVMLIDVRKCWGVLGPLAGDIVLFADGSAAVVTKPLCRGCQNFEGVSLETEGPPQIVKKVHWTATLKWIVRLVDESEPDVFHQEYLCEPPAAGSAPDMASSEAAPDPIPATAEDGAPQPTKPERKRRHTGQP